MIVRTGEFGVADEIHVTIGVPQAALELAVLDKDQVASARQTAERRNKRRESPA
jgi:hypothetical protein